MLRKTLMVLLALTLSFVIAVPAGAANAAKCTAQQGQSLIDQGRYKDAIREFTCVINADPTGVEGYRGRIEAQLLLGLFSEAVRDYTRVTALVEPVHPDTESIILDGYAARLAVSPHSIPALTGLSFAHWWFYDYARAIQVLNDLLALQPENVYANLFRGSSRLLSGATPAKGEADLDRALALAPKSPDVHYIVADGYLYGRADYERAFEEASFALEGGLDTPRVHAILAGAYNAFGDLPAAAAEIQEHIELVTTELVPAPALESGGSLSLALIPYRTVDIPVPVAAGETLSISTTSHDFIDSIAVLRDPDGSPVVGSDDAQQYFAAFTWTAPSAGTYHLWATSFEAVSTGVLTVSRK